MTDSLAAFRRNANAQDRQTLDELNTARAQLSSTLLRGTEEKDNAAYWATIKTMEEHVDELESRISARSAAFRLQSQPVTVEAVQKALPKDAALIEFVKYKIRAEDVQRALPSKSTSVDLVAMPSGTGKTPPPTLKKLPTRKPMPTEAAPVVNRAIPISATCRYVAYILLSDGEPAWVNLGEAKPIEEAVDALRQALRNKSRADVKALARKVDTLVMQPIRVYLGKALRVSLSNTDGRLVEQRTSVAAVRQLFVSPDGSLNLIPFAALVDEQGKYLVERYNFTYLTSGRDLLRLQQQQPSKEPPVVIADVDFNIPGNLAARPGAAEPSRGATPAVSATGPRIGGIQFEPLQELLSSLDEANTLKQLLKNATVWTKQAATETALKQVSGPAILHIATHGFFIEDGFNPQNTVVAGTRLAIRRTGTGEPLEMRLRNPLLRSGLFLAGANAGKSGNDDGVLTALEAAGLDLSGTKLVVLSACDTGLGEVRNGEGVYGLRRALVLAGSETQVISLWAVSDEGTRDLMNEYYRRLEAGEGRGEALRQTQLKLLANPKRQHPFYWASFIQSGEWANLNGKR
jgi:CHAT domain-containing protein